MNGRRARTIRQAVPAGAKWKNRVRQAKRLWARLSHTERKTALKELTHASTSRR